MNRSLALFALLALAAAPACGADDDPAGVAPKVDTTPRFVVLVINQTFRGQRDEVLAPFGIARLHGWSTLVKLERDLQRIVDRKNLYESTSGFAQWANPCDKPRERDLLVRRYGLRLWIHPVAHPDIDAISLQSLPWQGCNTFDLQ